MKRLDYLKDPRIQVWQDPDDFCFNTDTALLASFMKIRPGERVLDIGTNNGVLLKAADLFRPGHLYGVEIREQAARLAEENRQFLEADSTIFCCPVQDLQLEPVDVVLSNPPFFEIRTVEKSRLEQMSPRDLGRFEVHLTLRQLCEQAARLCRSHGRFYLVHRPERLNEIMDCLHAAGFSVHRMALACDSRTQEPRSILLEGIREGSTQVQMEKVLWI